MYSAMLLKKNDKTELIRRILYKVMFSPNLKTNGIYSFLKLNHLYLCKNQVPAYTFHSHS